MGRPLAEAVAALAENVAAPDATRPVNTPSTPVSDVRFARRSDAVSSDLAAPHSSNTWTWQQVTSRAVNDVDTLAQLLELDTVSLATVTQTNAFTLRVPHTFIARMQRGNPEDPLLLQVLNRHEEQQSVEAYTLDPLLEHTGSPCPGLIHKYPGRVLLTVASACPINCRYCFRRHFPYDDNRLTPSTWQPALDYIRHDSSIQEVILSGGEPLMLKDALLDSLLSEIEAIEHVSLIRIHSRFPVAVPQRITRDLATRLSHSRVPMTLVLHTNHPNEIDDTVTEALSVLRHSPVTLLNQTVLLKGVNDCADTLQRLSRKLFAAGVLPYYLHALDKVAGTAHFAISDCEARQLHQSLVDQLPGYLVPELVRETPGLPAKTRL